MTIGVSERVCVFLLFGEIRLRRSLACWGPSGPTCDVDCSVKLVGGGSCICFDVSVHRNIAQGVAMAAEFWQRTSESRACSRAAAEAAARADPSEVLSALVSAVCQRDASRSPRGSSHWVQASAQAVIQTTGRHSLHSLWRP